VAVTCLCAEGHAQGRSEIEVLTAEIKVLLEAGRYADAAEAGKRALDLAESRHRHEPQVVADAMSNLGEALRALGRYSDAEEMLTRALEQRQAGTLEFAHTALNLAVLYYDRGLYSKAEPLYLKVMEIRERSLGSEHIELAETVNNLAALYHSTGRYGAAESGYKRCIEIRTRWLGSDHVQLAQCQNNLAALYVLTGKFSEAEALYQKALVSRKKAFGDSHMLVGQSYNNLAALYRITGRVRESEALYRRDLEIVGRALGPRHVMAGVSRGNLAELFSGQGRYSEAEAELRKAIEIFETALGPEHLQVAWGLEILAVIYMAEARYGEAQQLLVRSRDIRVAALGRDNVAVAQSFANLGEVAELEGRHADAETWLAEAVKISTADVGHDHPTTATFVVKLGGLYRRLGRLDEARQLIAAGLDIRKSQLGPTHFEVAHSLVSMGQVDEAQGRHAEAEEKYQRANEILIAAWGETHPDVATVYYHLSRVSTWRGHWSNALAQLQNSTRIVVERSLIDNDSFGAVIRSSKLESVRNIERFGALVQIGNVLRTATGATSIELSEEFATAQRAIASEAGRAVLRMASRHAFAANTDLTELLRKKQDLVEEGLAIDKLLVNALAEAGGTRQLEMQRGWRSRFAEIEREIQGIDGDLVRKMPGLLVESGPLSISDVRTWLQANEALILPLTTEAFGAIPGQTFVWVVTKEAARRHSIPLDAQGLAERVWALRCGLDEEEWAEVTKAALCLHRIKALTGSDLTAVPEKSEPLPYHLGIAHELYKALLEPFEDMIAGKRLLIVPSGPLASLPFHALVTKADVPTLTFDGYRNAAWLARSHAIAVLPSVASIKALREQARNGEKATADYFGIGNPVLEGDGACRPSKVLSECRTDPASARPVRDRRGQRSANLRDVYAQGVGNSALLQRVRALCQLPDSAEELLCVAAGFAEEKRAILLDRSATESEIKKLSADRVLQRYRVVHFATHGLLAGDVEVIAKRRGEPALVLTPPEDAHDDRDDGLLTASEVAQLRLNADWVVLSACNTAASDGTDAEALSGLARAFFYAGARALLVSHWPVYSDAAVRLTTRAFAELDRKLSAHTAAVGRAEALQRAMIELIDDHSQDDNAHPAVWAPFVLVGEGAR
jgi:CHAT domain-containing protein/tetratricopeptide (TPR) repeat protein